MTMLHLAPAGAHYFRRA